MVGTIEQKLNIKLAHRDKCSNVDIVADDKHDNKIIDSTPPNKQSSAALQNNWPKPKSTFERGAAIPGLGNNVKRALGPKSKKSPTNSSRPNIAKRVTATLKNKIYGRTSTHTSSENTLEDTSMEAIQKREPKKINKTEEQMKKAAVGVGAKALDSVAPGAGRVAKKLAKTAGGQAVISATIKTYKKVIIAVVMVWIAIISSAIVFLFASTTSDNLANTVYNIDPSNITSLDIPDSYLEAYMDAAKTWNIPWTLLAAIGARASYHGRIDPYIRAVPISGGNSSTLQVSGDVYVLGDSLSTDEGTGNILRNYIGVDHYTQVAEVGWSTSAAAAAAKKTPPKDTAVVVVALGSNDARSETYNNYGKQIDKVMNVIGPNTKVYWLTLAGEKIPDTTRTTTTRRNKAIQEASTKYLNLEVVDWQQYAFDNQIEHSKDSNGNPSAHYEAAGYQQRADFIETVLTNTMPTSGITSISALSGKGVLATPQGSCPSLIGADAAGNALIGIPSKLEENSPISYSQGWGPLLLKPAAIAYKNGGDAEIVSQDVQNICTSLDILGSALSDSAQIVADKLNVSFPNEVAGLANQAALGDTSAGDFVHKFWASVVDNTDIIGTTGSSRCVIPARDNFDENSWIPTAISYYWFCKLVDSDIQTVTKVTLDTNGQIKYDTMTPHIDAVNQAVQEALDVSWLWSHDPAVAQSPWGSKYTQDIPCDEQMAGPAGIFPLTKTEFAQADLTDQQRELGRCDPETNIMAAADLFLNGEQTLPETREGFWNAARGGWGNIEKVIGTDPLFDAQGPWVRLQPSSECMTIAQNTLYSWSNTWAAQNASIVAADAKDLLISFVDEGVDNIVATLRADSIPCGPQIATAGLTELYSLVSGSINNETSLNVNAAILIESSSDPITGSEVSQAVANRAGELAVIPETPDSTKAMLQRLSSVGVVEHRLIAAPQVIANETNTDLGALLVDLAGRLFGGLFVGDTSISVMAGTGLLGAEVDFWEDFNAVGQQTGIDPRLLAAIARQESNFDLYANCDRVAEWKATRASDNVKDLNIAFGMMQIENDINVCGGIAQEPMTARQQIQKTATYMHTLYTVAGNNWIGAILGYNNGATFSAKWKDTGGNLEEIEAWAKDYYIKNFGQEDGIKRTAIAMLYIDTTPGARSVVNGWLEYQMLYPTSFNMLGQTAIGTQQCPTGLILSQWPNMTIIRDGANNLVSMADINNLCVESVTQAPSPQAALALIYIFNNLGIKYDTANRTKNTFDCSSFVGRAYVYAGVNMGPDIGDLFTTHTLQPWDGRTRPEWIQPIALFAAQPGDLVFPFEGHMGIMLARGLVAEAPQTGDITHIRTAYSTAALQINRVISSLATSPAWVEPLLARDYLSRQN
jgi:hypothetical protein